MRAAITVDYACLSPPHLGEKHLRMGGFSIYRFITDFMYAHIWCHSGSYGTRIRGSWEEGRGKEMLHKLPFPILQQL